MDDLRQRLKFDDIAVRSRCVQKLITAVKKKRRGEMITSSTPPIQELNLIWEACGDESTETSNLAIQGIVALVTNRHLDVKYAMNKFLSIITPTCNAYVLVKAISAIMMFEYNQTSETNRVFHYSLHCPKHPLITVLQTNDDYLPLILESISEAIDEDNFRGFQVMEPVICYILSNPTQRKRIDYSKVLLLETLIDIVSSQPRTTFYMLRFIPFLQVETSHQVIEASQFVVKAKRVFSEFECDEKDRIYVSEFILVASLSLCERNLAFGNNFSSLLKISLSLLQTLSKFDYYSSCVNVCLTLIGMILKATSGVVLEKFIAIGMALLDLKPVSPTVAAYVAFSVIQLLPEPSILSFDETMKSTLSQLLGKLELFFTCDLNNVDRSTDNDESSPKNKSDFCDGDSLSKTSTSDNFNYLEALTPSVESCFECVRFALKLDSSSLYYKSKWLQSIKEYLDSGSNDNLELLFSLAAAIFLMAPDEPKHLSSCLETIESVLLRSQSLSTRIFALLLYKQSLLKAPESKILILEYLPKCATHKYSIPPVISILKMMANETDLKALAIQLMLQLWKKQDRCFTYLHKQLVEPCKVISSDTGINEVKISQAAAIKEICQMEPEKYGKEFLDTLSSIFNESHDEITSAAACLALDGVISLCKYEVIDLRSTWKALAPRLIKDKRPLITCRMFQLLALVPELRVKSFEYDNFMSEVMSFIWKQIISGLTEPVAISAAYKALAEFPLDFYVLKQFPPAAKQNLKLPPSMKATPFDMGKLPEDVLTYIPGYCFTDLLKSLDNDIIIKGYTHFLHSLLKQELRDLPRSAFTQRRHIVKRENTCEVLSKVPGFLCSQIESRKSPAIQKNLSVGLLLCYEPPVEMGKDGQPIKRSLAAQYRFYEQVLVVLLDEVNIEASEWQRCILLPAAWGGYMERAFFACEEARKAELELQNSHGHLNLSPDELKNQCKLAWLWVRDRLICLIKTSAKKGPASHANSMFALTGLIYATNKFYTSLDDSSKVFCDESQNYIKHQDFLIEYTETVLCAILPDFQPNGNVHSWLLTHLSRPNSSASYLVKGCSCASLFHLMPVLINNYVNDIRRILDHLLENLSHNSPVLGCYSAIGLGLFIRSMCEIGLVDNTEKQTDLLSKTLNQIVRDSNSEESPLSNYLIALTISVASVAQAMHEEFKAFVSTTCNVFYEKLMEEDPSSMNFEILSICVSAMMVSASEGSCLPIEDVEHLASWFNDQRFDSPQCSGISVSCGILIEALERFGHGKGAEMKKKVQKDWLNTLTNEKRPTLHRIAALNGLCTLYSGGRGLMQIKSKATAGSLTALNDLVPLMFQILNAPRDTGLQNICSWEVGRLFSVNCSQQQVESTVSSSYSHLSEKSILKPVLNIILDGHKDDESDVKFFHVLACLSALGDPFPRPLPPLNWVTVLTPYLQMKNEAVLEAALKIAVNQASGSPHALNLISSYCNPPLIHTLPESCFLLLLKNLPGLGLVLPSPKLEIFLQFVISSTIKEENGFKKWGLITLQNILTALEEKGYKQRSLSIVQDAFISVFKYFRNDYAKVIEHLSWITQGLLLLPKDGMDTVISVSENVSDISVLTMIWCNLVKCGKVQLTCLRPCIEEGKHASPEDKALIYISVYKCFLSGILNKESEVSQATKCISWLLETIGWIKVLCDSKSKYQLMTMKEIIDWLLLLIKSEYLSEIEKYHIKLSLCSMKGLQEFQKTEVWTEIICNIKDK
ncbi:focadhesin-like isoform X2 [Stegodyphus dumicola]|uniref:focadhesin-like isoform X2 n=1 Tax=Stegodyphus dumicola TaxID=202533 RepID=UPI0015A8E10E|nr:focadhesin-like isoform X2 [Stegodyphus dumicola]